MKPRDIFFAFFIHSLFLICATESGKYSDSPDMIGTTEAREELTSVFISAQLGDIIILTAPFIVNTTTIYYLTNPDGDSTKLNINSSRVTTDFKETRKHDEYIAKWKITSARKRREIRLNEENYGNNYVASYSDFKIEPNEYTIGPLSEDDHGNWALSLYYKGELGDWMELFHIISVSIVETFPTHAPDEKLVPGQTFEPRLLYPINDLQSCEIRVPRTTFDRFYDRDKFYLDSCGFRIPNVTKDDEGLWTIIGVGKIVYKGEVYLQIDEDIVV